MGGWTEIFGLEDTQWSLKTGCLNTWLAFGGLSWGEAKPSHLLQKVSNTQSRGWRFPFGKSLWALKLSVPLANSVYLSTAQNPGKPFPICHISTFYIFFLIGDLLQQASPQQLQVYSASPSWLLSQQWLPTGAAGSNAAPCCKGQHKHL